MANVCYALVQRKNPNKKDAPKLFYATAQKNGDLTLDEIKDHIAHSSTATAGDVALVLESLLREISDALKGGKAVVIDRFGKFRLSLSSTGSKTMKEFTKEMIKGTRILFCPSREMKIDKSLLSFEQKDTVKEQKAQLRAKFKGEGSTPTAPVTPPEGGGGSEGDKIG